MRRRLLRFTIAACMVRLSSGLVPAVPAAAGAAHTAAVAAGLHAGSLPAAAAALHSAALSGGVTHAAASAAAHALSGHGAASAAANLAVGATTAGIVVAPSAERPKPASPELRAIGRILQVEFARLRSAAFRDGPNTDPVEAAYRVQETAQTRAPIIKWALNAWVRGTLRRTQESLEDTTYRKAGAAIVVDSYDTILDGVQGTILEVPGIMPSLRILRQELTFQVRYGFGTAPLRVIRLLGTSLIVTILALVARLPVPGLRPARLLRGHWPRLVDHLAATFEHNLEHTEGHTATGSSLLMPLLPTTDIDASIEQAAAEFEDLKNRFEDLKDRFEDATGLDIDGDGFVGKPPEEAAGPFAPLRRLTTRARSAVAGVGDDLRYTARRLRNRVLPKPRQKTLDWIY